MLTAGAVAAVVVVVVIVGFVGVVVVVKESFLAGRDCGCGLRCRVVAVVLVDQSLYM